MFYRIYFDEDTEQNVIEPLPGTYTQPAYDPISADWCGTGEYFAVLSEQGLSRQLRIYRITNGEVSDCSISSNLDTDEYAYHVNGCMNANRFVLSFSNKILSTEPGWWPDGTQSGCPTPPTTTSGGEPFNYWSPVWASWGHRALFESSPGNFFGYSPENKTSWITYDVPFDEEITDLVSIPYTDGPFGDYEPYFKSSTQILAPAEKSAAPAPLATVRSLSVGSGTLCYSNSRQGSISYNGSLFRVVSDNIYVTTDLRLVGNGRTFAGFTGANRVQQRGSYWADVSTSPDGEFLVAPRYNTSTTVESTVVLKKSGNNYAAFDTLTSAETNSFPIRRSGFNRSNTRLALSLIDGWKVFSIGESQLTEEFDSYDWLPLDIQGTPATTILFKPR